MSANDKFNLSAHSPDGPSYTNGHRGPYSVTSFERSGGFRDASGNSIPSSFLSMSKSVCAPSHGEGTNILKSLILHLKPVVLDQKFPRPGEMNRAVSSIIGISSAQSLQKTIPPRPLTSASVDEIRSLKNNLHENSIKARDRVKAFNEATMKIEKHCRNISKKRSRITSTSNDQPVPTLQGGNIPRASSQGLQCTSGIVPGHHKLDERTKNTLQNRKLQTSLVEMDARPIGISKASGPPDRGRDASEFGPALSEERSQEPLLAVEGWDNLRTKKKRSTMKSDVSASAILATQPKFLGEAKPRVNSNGLRHKSQQDACSGSPTSNPKMSQPARGPRSSLATFPKASGSPQQTLRGSDERDPRNFVRQNSFNGAIDRKHSVSARSPSPPVAHWSGQRSQKFSRGARRSNCSPIVSDHHEAPSSDTTNNAISNEDNPGVARCSTSNASRQVKPKVDDILSGGLSESEESGVANYKSKNKIKKHDTQGTIGQTVQKVGALLLSSKKRKPTADGDANVGIPRPKIEQGIISTRPSIVASNEKASDIGMSFQQRKSKVRSERSESKSGRSPLKSSERKGHTRHQHSINAATLDFPGEPVDDTEALFSAANAVVDARKPCSSTFWKQIQPFFNFLSSGHITFLKEQIRLVDESTPNSHIMGDDGQKIKGDLEYISLPSTPASSINECDRDVGLAWQMEHVDPFIDQLVQGIGSQGGVSICQVLLSALIEEEDFDNSEYSNLTDDPALHDCQGVFYDPKIETKSTGVSLRTSSTLRVGEGHFSNGFMSSSIWHCPGQLLHQKLGSNGISLDAEPLYTEYEYSQMGINDRIVLELRQLGLYPDPMPELAPNEDENISTSINCLQEKLHGQVLKKKHILLNLEKVVLEERMTEQRELERFALDRLVWMTYEKYMAYLRPISSSSKTASKHNRHAALSHAKQALARCHKFENKGVNCFSESAFKEIFLSISSNLNDTECTGMTSDGGTGKNATTVSRLRQNFTDNGPIMVSKQSQLANNQVKSSDAIQTVNHSLEETFDKDDPFSNRGRKRELLLDDVVDSSPQGSLQISRGTLHSGTKGKRSNREGNPSKDVMSRNHTAKNGRASTSNVKGARRNKTKLKQRTTNLSASINDLCKAEEAPKPDFTSTPRSLGVEDRMDDADAAELPPEIDVCGFDGNGQDIDSWLNIDDDGLQDHDFMEGLQIPMDDLSSVF